ncbi:MULTISPECIES: hypothetical protein [unclassified Erwinia]|nr:MULTISPECIES: hypothetical protein [unclassified Erwinia]
MIKTLSVCAAVIMLVWIGFVGHYYYQTFSHFNNIEHAQQSAEH